ncbi:hypothetical protein HN615_12535 [Candidatus Woesearchaeota archaeon]|jgi:hypothetical protein|nr:hypothetical protein [Candidatus Woesearchaeota archaeon]
MDKDLTKKSDFESIEKFITDVKSIDILKRELAKTPIDYDNIGPIPKKRFERKTKK